MVAAPEDEATDALQLLAGSCCLFSPCLSARLGLTGQSLSFEEPLLLSLQLFLPQLAQQIPKAPELTP